MTQTALTFLQDLIRIPTVTPHAGAALDYIIQVFEPFNPRIHRMTFSQEGTPDVDNLFLSVGTGNPHFCFAGHVDVVPAGEGWHQDPFGATLVDDHLYGRGACDMKGSIAAFMAALISFKKDFPSSSCTISLLLTCDEEGPALNGTKKMLDYMAQKNLIPDACMVGEPTSKTQVGDMVKMGRRGSLCLTLTVMGQAGHVAYPHLADDPVGPLAQAILALKHWILDEGTAGFDPSTLAFSSLTCPNQATNVIPGSVSINFNVRFNPLHTCDSLYDQIRKRIHDTLGNRSFTLTRTSQAEPFLTHEMALVDLMCESITQVTGVTPERSTSGGTSDARFIHFFCPVVEFGPLNATIHQANEVISLNELEILERIYRNFLNNYFSL